MADATKIAMDKVRQLINCVLSAAAIFVGEQSFVLTLAIAATIVATFAGVKG
jgi:hypothetical protein